MNELEMLLEILDVVHSLEDRDRLIGILLFPDRSGHIIHNESKTSYVTWGENYTDLFGSFTRYIRRRFQQR